MSLQKILAESHLNCTGHFRDEGSLEITLSSPGEPIGTSGLGQTFTFPQPNERQLSSASLCENSNKLDLGELFVQFYAFAP
jgi:hypothetical protein